MLHKILIVDDEEQVRKTIGMQLKNTDYVVIEAENGEKAIEVLDAENVLEVDTIICDVRMPKIGGVEAVAYFRREYPSIPVIVLTGYPDVKLAVDFMKEGVVDYLVKPVEKEKLIDVVPKAARQRTLFSSSAPNMSRDSAPRSIPAQMAVALA
jgi:two-component system chemotaxis response regulator CheY